MADKNLSVTVTTAHHKETDFAYHLINSIGPLPHEPFAGHTLHGGDCLCEPTIRRCRSMPDVKLYFHETLTGVR